MEDTPGAAYLPPAKEDRPNAVLGDSQVTHDVSPSPTLMPTVQLPTSVPPNPSSTPIFRSTKPQLKFDQADWLLNVLQVLLLGNHPTLQLRLCQPRSSPW